VAEFTDLRVMGRESLTCNHWWVVGIRSNKGKLCSSLSGEGGSVSRRDRVTISPEKLEDSVKD
jgi:hypothetical protein